MSVKKFLYIKNRKKLKILLLLIVLGLIVITLIVLHNSSQNRERLFDERLVARGYIPSGNNVATGAVGAAGSAGGGGGGTKLTQSQPLLKSPQENGVIVPEKYDEQKIKARIMQDKIINHQLQDQQQLKQQNGAESGEEHITLNIVTSGIHIFYNPSIQWYKSKKAPQKLPVKELLSDGNNLESQSVTTPKPVRTLNTAFYPALGLYKPTTSLMQKHFENIRNCGIGVLILSYTGKPGEIELYNQILDLAPNFNISVTFEISVAGNQSVEFLRQQLLVMKKFSKADGLYRVYVESRKSSVPLIYISNAYKLSETAGGRMLCHTYPESLRETFDALFIGHIRLKNHAEVMRRLCFEGFYSKLPSNGATFASTWKNWSYLKSFALTYKMLFVPTVGPGFAERNKFPRHGDIQRHRSNGRYYGVAWRTAILNHVGFINIASYNNWPDGSQIEEVIPKAGFLDYNPGSKTKYLDLTTHWVGNFLKTRQESIASAANGAHLSCYELLNNTIC